LPNTFTSSQLPFTPAELGSLRSNEITPEHVQCALQLFRSYYLQQSVETPRAEHFLAIQYLHRCLVSFERWQVPVTPRGHLFFPGPQSNDSGLCWSIGTNLAGIQEILENPANKTANVRAESVEGLTVFSESSLLLSIGTRQLSGVIVDYGRVDSKTYSKIPQQMFGPFLLWSYWVSLERELRMVKCSLDEHLEGKPVISDASCATIASPSPIAVIVLLDPNSQSRVGAFTGMDKMLEFALRYQKKPDELNVNSQQPRKLFASLRDVEIVWNPYNLSSISPDPLSPRSSETHAQ